MSQPFSPEWIRRHWPTCSWLNLDTATYSPVDPLLAVTGWCDRPAEYVAFLLDDGEEEPTASPWCGQHLAALRADPSEHVVGAETLVIEGIRS